MTWSKASRQSRGYGRQWEIAREQALRRDHYLCQVCLAVDRITSATQVHHIIEKADGGTDDLGNLVSICVPCHALETLLAKGHKPKARYDKHGRRIEPLGGLDRKTELEPIGPTAQTRVRVAKTQVR